ncbi:MAG: putative tRNA-dihydrouridine synthase [Candidatus Anoxychlamydiales bacterium]|nr:putative tRNA-dihydrouridine synthase [Candidatus Anoxychlamydiales bacterium]
MSFKKSFKIKNLILDSNIFYAPLAEYTDFAYRKLLRHYHKGLMFCEMIKMEALVREKTTKQLKYTQNMRPIGAQLCGANLNVVKEASKKIEDQGFDWIDLNCGCPVPKVTKDGSGAALLKNPKLISDMLKTITSSVNIPVSVKIRAGWDDNSICFSEIVKIAIDAGCSAITIHGRTKKQGYSGKSNWDYIKQCKEIAGDKILVIGNGDLYTPQDVKDIFDKTACDGVMIARGMLQTPWLSLDVENYYNKKQNEKIIIKDVLLKYIDYVMQEKDGKNAVFDLRRISGWILRGYKDIKQLRIVINKADSITEIRDNITSFGWEKQ